MPRGVPEITVQPQSPMTVLVEWSPLSNSVARGIVREYKVQWRRRRNPSTLVELVPGDVTRYVIPGESHSEVNCLAFINCICLIFICAMYDRKHASYCS